MLVLESLFNKVEGLKLYLKESPAQALFCKICEFFQNNYFEESANKANKSF